MRDELVRNNSRRYTEIERANLNDLLDRMIHRSNGDEETYEDDGNDEDDEDNEDDEDQESYEDNEDDEAEEAPEDPLDALSHFPEDNSERAWEDEYDLESFTMFESTSYVLKLMTQLRRTRKYQFHSSVPSQRRRFHCCRQLDPRLQAHL